MNRVTLGRWALMHIEAAKNCYERGDVKQAEHWLRAACDKWSRRNALSMRPHHTLIEHRNSVSRCPFCGKRNGLWWHPLEQHGPRCRYKGDADNFDVSVPNYNQMIDEDDKLLLPMLQAVPMLRAALLEIEKLRKKLEHVPES